MKSADMIEMEKAAIVQKMNEAAAKGDTESFSKAFVELCEMIQENVLDKAREIVDQNDTQVLSDRGVRQLTSKENQYYAKVIEAMRSANPKQAVSNLDIVMPETVIDSVFKDLETSHPLLSKIQFTSVAGLTRMMMNTNGYQKAAWGKLTGQIIQELTSGFKEVDVTQDKLSAFIPISKAMLDLGPTWLDSYIRSVLYEALANGLEDAIVNGTGKEMPVGMIRQVGDDVSVKGGEYPEKPLTKVTKFDNIQLGKLASLLAINEKGQTRPVHSLILLVNPSDYFSRVLPAIQYMAPGGGYVTTLPFEIDIIQSAAVPPKRAVFGMASHYFAGSGMGNKGRIEYSDEYHFLEDERVYLIKLYANGFPVDNTSFFYLDISELQPLRYKVEILDNTTDAEDAALCDLKISGVKLKEEFKPGTLTYTGDTTNASSTVTAVTAKATAEISVVFKEKEYANGTRLTWDEGENIVTVKVKDGSATKDYTITVTKASD